jgi:hypothetical protein
MTKPKGKPRGRPFQAGNDPRRHQFTVEDCRKGFAAMLKTPMPSRTRVHLRRKIMRRYRGKGKPSAARAAAAHAGVYG